MDNFKSLLSNYTAKKTQTGNSTVPEKVAYVHPYYKKLEEIWYAKRLQCEENYHDSLTRNPQFLTELPLYLAAFIFLADLSLESYM
jgi:hypothetical protein